MEPGVKYILEASIKLECNLEVTNKALLTYHRFMREKPEPHQYDDPAMIAAAALNISGSLTPKPLDLDALICVFDSTVNKTLKVLSTEDESYQEMKKGLLSTQHEIMRSLKFNFSHRLAHQYIVPFLKMISTRCDGVKSLEVPVGRTVLRFINDFYMTKLCLDHQPEIIAISCLDLTLNVHGLIEEVHDNMMSPWYMGFARDITPSEVEEIKKKILKFYEENDSRVKKHELPLWLEDKLFP